MSTRFFALLLSSLMAGPAAVRGQAPKAPPPKADPAFANPAFANPDTPGLLAGQPKPDVANTADIVFLKQLAFGSRAEVELGRLAQDRSTAAHIDEFGQHMVADHTDANRKLAAVAKSAGVQLPSGLDAEHEAARGELDRLRGKDFDLRYIDSQIEDHQKAVQLLVHVIASGQHVGVRDFATQTLPTVMDHLERARALRAQLTLTPAPPAARADR